MSLDQIKAFVEGLKKLSDSFRQEARGYTEAYKAEVQAASDKLEAVYPEVKEAATDFHEASHDYAKSMINAADEYVTDIQELYDGIYGDEAEEDE